MRIAGRGLQAVRLLARASARLEGAVWNDGAGVVVEAVGSKTALEQFLQATRSEAPPAALIERIEHAPAPDLVIRRHGGFHISPSRNDQPVTLGVSPDLATCGQCLAEFGDAADRRFAYAFTKLRRLRAEAQHPRRRTLRPSRDDHGGVHDVRGLPARVRPPA